MRNYTQSPNPKSRIPTPILGAKCWVLMEALNFEFRSPSPNPLNL